MCILKNQNNINNNIKLNHKKLCFRSKQSHISNFIWLTLTANIYIVFTVCQMCAWHMNSFIDCGNPMSSYCYYPNLEMKRLRCRLVSIAVRVRQPPSDVHVWSLRCCLSGKACFPWLHHHVQHFLCKKSCGQLGVPF